MTKTGSAALRLPPGAVIGLYHVKARRLYRFDEYRPEQNIMVGRHSTCDIRVRDRRVSAIHFEVEQGDGDTWVVKDAGSKNGLWVNDLRVTEALLSPGMWIAIGKEELIAMGTDGIIPILARRCTSLLIRSARLYGGMRRAAQFVGRSSTTIWRAIRRKKQ